MLYISEGLTVSVSCFVSMITAGRISFSWRASSFEFLGELHPKRRKITTKEKRTYIELYLTEDSKISENKDIEKIQAVLEKNLDEKLMINEVKTKRLNKQGKRVLLIDADPQRRFNYLYGLL